MSAREPHIRRRLRYAGRLALLWLDCLRLRVRVAAGGRRG